MKGMFHLLVGLSPVALLCVSALDTTPVEAILQNSWDEPPPGRIIDGVIQPVRPGEPLSTWWMRWPPVMVAPYFLAVLILLLQLRLFWKKGVTQGEALSCHALALAGLGCTAYALLDDWRLDAVSMTSLSTWAALLLAFATIVLSLKEKIGRDEAALLALRAAWIPSAVLGACAFWDAWHIGAYVPALTVPLFSTQITQTKSLFTKREGPNIVHKVARIVAHLPAVMLLFVSYAEDTSPLQVVSDGWLREVFLFLAAPFFLAVPILLLQLRLLWNARVMRTEGFVYRGLAIAGLGCTALSVLTGVAGVFEEPFTLVNLAALILGSVLVFLAAATIILSMRRRMSRDEASLVALRAAWIPNVAFCGLVFWAEWQTGAYMAAFTLALFAYEITRQMGRYWRMPRHRSCE